MKTSRFISLLLCVVMIMSLFTGLAGSASADDVITHEVKSGEIMLKICEKHGLNYYACKDAIMQLNGFTSEAQLGKLSVGQKLRLPASDGLAKTASTSTAVVTTTTVGNTTLTTTTNYVGTTAAGGNVAYYLTPYTVQAGDTLAGICSKLNSNYYYYSPVILGVNALANANYIRPGQVLLIPTTSASSGGYAVVAHTVQNGETMTAICNRYGISYQAMRTLVNGVNRRDNMDKIYVGQTVYVPGTASGVAAAATTTTTTTTAGTGTVSTGTATGTTTGTAAVSGYTITLSNSAAFASCNGKDYVTSAPAGSEVSVWSAIQTGYAVKSIDVIRLDTGAVVPVDYNYFTMPNSNVYVDVTYEKGLTIQKDKTLYGSFDALVYGSSASAAFQGDEVVIAAYPYNYYTVSSVSYQRSDNSVSPVEVKPDASGNYKFSMPSYPIRLKVTFAPAQYHALNSNNIIGRGRVEYKVGGQVVSKAEQGQKVTMTFIAEPNYTFNSAEFENNLLTHMPARNTVGGFRKINDTTYTFVMGTSDVIISGPQFLNRTVYNISVNKQAGGTSGEVTVYVIDQMTGNISKTNKAKFGDQVQVTFKPSTNYIVDLQYVKDNSFANGNLLSWDAGSTFTMPDGNVKLDVRFIIDNAEHKYSQIKTEIIPANAATVTINNVTKGGIVADHAELNDILTVTIQPKPNYAVTKIGTGTYAVSLNKQYVGTSPTLIMLGGNPNKYTFVKSAGTDTVRVVLASDYQSTPVKFQQIIASSTGSPSDPPFETPVERVDNLRINGAFVENATNVIAGDTISFNLTLNPNYELYQMRKYVLDSSNNEVPETSRLIQGGAANGYSFSYTVTPDDIYRNASGEIDGTLVFEITTRPKAAYSYTVKYTKPMCDGKDLEASGAYYTIETIQTSTGNRASTSTSGPVSKDILDISANMVNSDDVTLIVKIPKAANTNIMKTDPQTQKTYLYSFKALLINGSEWPCEMDSTDYIANYVYPKDTKDRIVTVELAYECVGEYDTPLSTLDDILIDNAALPNFKPGVLNYSVFSTNDGTVTPLADATVSGNVQRRIVINGAVYMDYTDTAPISAVTWRNGDNTVEIYTHDSTGALRDNKYTVTVNYDDSKAFLTDLKISAGGKDATGMEKFTSKVTHYEAHVADKSVTITPTPAAGATITKATINGQDCSIPMTAILNPGKNDVVITVSDGIHTTDYTVSLYCDYDAPTTTSSKLATIEIGSVPITIVDGQLVYDQAVTFEEYKVTATLNGSDKGDITISWSSGSESGTDKNTFPTSGTVSGSDTVTITVTEPDKSPTTYTVNVTCNLDASKLTKLAIKNPDGTFTDILVEGQTVYPNVPVKLDEGKIEVKTDDSTTSKVTASLDGVDKGEWTDDGSYENPCDWNWKDGNPTSRQLELKVKEKDKTETTYTLTIVDDRDPSELENYLTIEGTPVMFNSEHKGSASPLKQESDVMIVLKNGPTVDAIKIELNGTELTNGTNGTDGAGNPTKEFFGTDAIKWTAENNELKITLRYEDHKETTYTVAVTCQPVDVTLKEFKIGANSYSVTGASGLTMHAGETISAATTDPNATVEVTVYGGANGPSIFPTTPGNSAVGTEGTSKDFQWNTSGGEESIRIEVIVKNGAHTSDPYVYTGKFEFDTSLAEFKIGSTIYPPTGYSGITMKSGDTVSATATSDEATITLKISGDGVGPWMFPGGKSIAKNEGTSGDFQWSSTDSKTNTIEVTVTNGSATSTYIFSGTTA